MSPSGGIIVIGRNAPFLGIFENAQEAVDELQPFLAEDPRRLRIDDLQFYDAAGSELEPVLEGDRLQALAMRTYEVEILQQIKERFAWARPLIELEAPRDPGFDYSATLDFVEATFSLEELADRLKVDFRTGWVLCCVFRCKRCMPFE
jgi:hypothetical protein